MLFRKNEPENIKPDTLNGLLVSLFEKKLGQFEAKAQAIINSLGQAKIEFIDVCNKFEKLDVAPYTEDMRFANINFIKGQKELYVTALLRIISKMRLEADDTISYNRYKLILSNIDEITNEILKTNAHFKLVMYCYSSYIGDFKKTFSAIERFREALRREIDSRSNEASEYAKLKEQITRLNSQIDELEALGYDINALKAILNSKDKSIAEEDEAKLSESLSTKKAGLSKLNGEISKLSETISVLTIPLERPSKKLDHLSPRKKPLYYFIANPVKHISSETEYNEFVVLVKELKEAIDKETIDTKNKAGTTGLISTLLNSGLYNIINSLKLLQHKRSEVEDEIKSLEIIFEGIKKGKDTSEKTIQDMAVMEEKAKEIIKSTTSIKSMIEAMFSSYYRKSISIVL